MEASQIGGWFRGLLNQTMKKNRSFVRNLLLAVAPAMAALSAHADAVNGTLYYTTFSGAPNIHKVDYSYDGLLNFSLATPVDIGTTVGADGIVFNPNNGNLLIGGQGNQVHEITTGGAPVTTQAPGVAAFHLSVDPSKKIVWAAGIPGQLSEMPLTPNLGAGIPYTMIGSESGIDSIAWRGTTAVYTSSDPNGGEFFGTIVLNTTLKTATTIRLGTAAATHSVQYDPFTDDFIFIGDNHITQRDGTTLAIVSDLAVGGIVSFDQGAIDGKGHAFVADNGGKLLFIDYSSSALVNDPANFTATPFLANFLDDVAPIAGPGGSQSVPETTSSLLALAMVVPSLFLAKRKLAKQS
jgi:hypothetical protein